MPDQRPYQPLKTCNKCHIEKPLREFYKNVANKDKHTSNCKICNRKQKRASYYRNHDARKTYAMKYNHSDRGRAARKRYTQTQKGKTALEESHKRTHARYPERYKAKIAVNNAIKAGRITPVYTEQCYYCGITAEQYHHHLGYLREHWLDVLPVCRTCHTECHSKKKAG